MKHLFIGLFSILLLQANIKANHLITDINSVDYLALNTPQYATSSIESLVIYGQSYTQSELDLVRFYFVWIADNVKYDTSETISLERNLSKQRPDSVFLSRKAICRGYSELLAILCQKSGIDARTVAGFTKKENEQADFSETHAWNAIKIEGKWHLFDVTWASNYLETCGIPDCRFDEYFFRSPEDFSKRHFPFDPIWQLSNDVITFESFKSGKIDKRIHFFDDFAKILNDEALLLSLDQNLKSAERAVSFVPAEKRLHSSFNYYKSEKAYLYFEKANFLLEKFRRLKEVSVRKWSIQDIEDMITNAKEAQTLFSDALAIYDTMSDKVDNIDLELIQTNKTSIAKNLELTGRLIDFLKQLYFDLNKSPIAGINKRT